MAEKQDKHDESAERTLDAENASISNELVEVLDQYLQDLKDGKANRDALLAAHPHLADQLHACLAGIEFIHGGDAKHANAQPQTLGDFRILREVGRGGMGAVYEAEQVSLGRRVALKVMRLAPVSDPQAMERFQREAETVAKLHHTNIVPIFSVGSEHGVNYYAMQFIEGRSLADVLAESKKPISPDTIAQWGLQAAEALAHAHQRQVIHRDVKPSNLILDQEDRIWLTDFGLAKRLDDVSLSMTGALLGTPRYMSPEQAAAATHRIDHRTDIYSLGATLYELATGHPVFSANTAHAVISQIIHDTPTAPRRHRPALPRDLETILMKCLDKDPTRRYASAGELSSDLRAFLEGRPIAARSENAIQRGIKWARRHRRTVTTGATAVAATLLLVLGSALGWQFWKAATAVHIKLSSNAPPLVVQVLDEQGNRVRPPVTVPTQQEIEVPSGDLQLQASSSGRFTQTYQARFPRGSSRNTKIDVIDQVIADLGPVTTYGIVEFEDGVDCFLTTEQGIRRVDGETGTVLWEVDLLAESNHAEAAKLGRFIRAYDQNPQCRRGQDSWNVAPGFVRQGIDLDNDEHADVICYLRHEALLFALSGKDGKVLWKVTDEDYVDRPRNKMAIHGTVIGEPEIVGDLDDDGTEELLATFVMDVNTVTEQQTGRHNRAVRRWIDVLSGRTGQSLWRHYLDDAFFALSKFQDVPYAFRWHCDDSFYADIFRPMSFHRDERAVRGDRPWAMRKGEYAYAPAAARVIVMPQTVDGELVQRKHVVTLAGQSVVMFDLASGKPVGEPFKLDVQAAAPVQWRDVDGDGVVELIVLEERTLLPPKTGVPLLDPPPAIRIVVRSLVEKKPLWRRDLKAFLPHQPQFDIPAPDWPLIADLNRDGRSEILVPNGTSSLGEDGVTYPWGELQALDASTGEPLWTKRIPTMDQQLDRFIIGPDIDQDGHDEVFVGSISGMGLRPHYVYVDCLSGTDGSTLWRSRHEVYRKSQWSCGVAALTWRRTGKSFPELVVQVTPRAGMPRNNAATFVFDPRNGDLVSDAMDIVDVELADVDADRVDEILARWVGAEAKTSHDNMKLSVLAGTRGELWRRLGGGQYFAAADFDNDGVRDLMVTTRRGVSAVSSRTGDILWGPNGKMLQTAWEHQFEDYTQGQRAGDLNGDGTADQLMFLLGNHLQVRSYAPLHAISGSDGRALWKADIDVRTVAQMVNADVQDLDGDGQPEVVFVAAMDWGYERTEAPVHDEIRGGQLWVTVLSGQSGRVQWKQPLSAAYGSDTLAGETPISFDDVRFDLQYVDLDGDDVLDFVIPAEKTRGNGELEQRALSGKDGKILWRRDIPVEGHVSSRLVNAAPVAIEDVNDDGQPEVIAIEYRSSQSESGAQRIAHVAALDGSSGEPIWDWHTETTNSWGRHSGASHLIGAHVKPFVIRVADDRRFVCVKMCASDPEQAFLAILDGRGQLVQEVAGEGGSEMEDFHAWPCDVDGNGQDEILICDAYRTLRMIDPAREWKAIWSAQSKAVRIADVLEIVDGRDGKPGSIFVRHRTPKAILIAALDARTGRDRWICHGPRTGHLGMLKFERHALLSTDAGESVPHAVFMYNNVCVSRRAARVGDKVAINPSMAVSLPAVGFDPRLYRRLPWVTLEADEVTDPNTLLWAVFFSVFLIILPAGVVGWMFWRRQFGLKFLLLLPVVALLFLFAWRVDPENGAFNQVGERFGAALLMVPVLLCVGLLLRWCLLRRFRAVLIWLMVAVGCTAVVIVFGFLDKPLASGERYLWEGWYLILYPGLYFAACVSLGGLLLLYAGRSIYRRFALPKP